MADPLKIIRRLEAVTTDYAVFERDQVLTHEQLNSVAEYLDDQSRLTRTQLLGVGIVGGLLPALGKGRITIGKGVGVTSDGDLLGLAVDTVFDRFLPYAESAPAYEPFYVADKMLHMVVPALAFAGWAIFGPRPRIDWREIRLAILWPLAWLAETLVVGGLSGWYPYPFLDHREPDGTTGVVVSSLGITVFFLLLFWLARTFDQRAKVAP